MEPKEKARELVEEYMKIDIELTGCEEAGSSNSCTIYGNIGAVEAKQCALIAVGKILEAFETGFSGIDKSDVSPDIIYWQKVKQAIINE